MGGGNFCDREDVQSTDCYGCLEHVFHDRASSRDPSRCIAEESQAGERIVVDLGGDGVTRPFGVAADVCCKV